MKDLPPIRDGLEAMLAKCADDAQRVAVLREALRLEMGEHLETCNRWIAIEAALKKRIAKARALYRDKRAMTMERRVVEMYRALGWRSR